MRATVLAALLALPALAGCIGTSTLQDNALGPLPFDLAGLAAEGATVERLAGAVRLVWDAELPVAGKAYQVEVPEGVTYVEARLEWPEDAVPITTPIRESGPERRCPRFTDLWSNSWTCRGLTVLDPFPQTWTFDLLPAGTAEAPIPFRLEITLTGGPVDGSAGLIRTDRLSQPLFDVVQEAPQYVEARDGTPLYVEVHRPDTEAKVPAILISSPYNNAVRAVGDVPYVDQPYHTVPDYVPRGYAVVVADVRGFGNSGGCVEVWGRNEQSDQYDLVEWVAAQPWSDGKVGMFGQSYVGTTAVEGAFAQPPHLEAIVAVAPVINAYDDWHFGGVPNGESLGSPLGYQMTGSEAPAGEADQGTLAQLLAGSYCDTAPLVLRANDPRAVYDEFYRERNFSSLAAQLDVPVLYTQGHFDQNVKSQMAVHWFNDLAGPKKGLFGPWFHRHPPRADQDLYFHAWFDQFLKGIDTGVLGTPAAEVQTLQGGLRTGTSWPARDAQGWALHLDADGEALAPQETPPSEATYTALPARGLDDVLVLSPLGVGVPVDAPSLPTDALWFTLPAVDARRYLSGAAMLDLTLTLEGPENTFVAAYLYEQEGEERRPLTFGWGNAALRNSYESYEPAPAGQPFALTVPFLPTEWAVEPGKELVLEVRAVVPSDWSGGLPTEPGRVTLHTGDGRSVLRLPVLDVPGDQPSPRSSAVV